MTFSTLSRDQHTDPPADRRTGPATALPVPVHRRPERGTAGIARTAVPAERAALAALLVGTALLYLWGLGASGWANTFYSAAAQAGSESWKAFFFGSSDAASSITVDKTPLALWPMGLSVRIFGLSSWSILVPQALEGVGAVALLYATVRRTTGSAGAGLLSGAVLALTPVAVLMFRFNNPDAMLVLLLVASAYATLRAVEASVSTGSTSGSGSTSRSGSTGGGRAVRWLAFAGVLVGLAFLAKMMQAFLVLPALIAVYAGFAAVPWRRRVLHLLAAFAGMVLAAGWWIAIVELWPAASRPYIGGSQDNSILELTLGYNGFGRLDGSEVGSVGGGTTTGGQWGATGLWRMFGSEVGTQVAWLVPAALILGVAGWWFARGHAGRAVRAGLALWLGWLLVTGLTFSFMAGIFHAYYTVALAPAIGALVGIGGLVLWRHRASLVAAAVLGLATAFTTGLAFELLGRDASWHPWLRYVIAFVGFAAALLLVGVRHLPRRVGVAVASAAVIAGLTGPAAYSFATAATPHTGSIPSAGPSSSGFGGPPGGFGGGFGGGPGGTPPTGASPGGTFGGPTTGGANAGGTTTSGAGAGGLLDGSTSSAALTALLEADSSSYTWVAAAVGSNSAAGYQLATQEPVMAIGGFNGSDPSPTLAQFKAWVAAGRIHYFIAGGFGGGGGLSAGGSTSTQISQWVESSYTSTTVDGVTVYDLTTPAG
jgi:4-amino-4-deoxy-L-arabinose transferase-like glycosyltransferase